MAPCVSGAMANQLPAGVLWSIHSRVCRSSWRRRSNRHAAAAPTRQRGRLARRMRPTVDLLERSQNTQGASSTTSRPRRHPPPAAEAIGRSGGDGREGSRLARRGDVLGVPEHDLMHEQRLGLSHRPLGAHHHLWRMLSLTVSSSFLTMPAACMIAGWRRRQALAPLRHPREPRTTRTLGSASAAC